MVAATPGATAGCCIVRDVVARGENSFTPEPAQNIIGPKLKGDELGNGGGDVLEGSKLTRHT